MPRIDDFRYLWDGSDPGWTLVQLDPGSVAHDRLVIMHAVTRTALVVEDDKLRSEVVDCMLRAEVPIVPVSRLR